MKRLIFILIILSVFGTSCERRLEQCMEHKEPVITWNGKDITLGYKEYPVGIIWFRGSDQQGWTPYKGFNKATEIKSIINLLDKPEVSEPRTELRTKNKLSLIYYPGESKFLQIIEVYFDVNDGVFIGPRGKSQELGKILAAKEESGLSRYRFHTPPYDEQFIDTVERAEKLTRTVVKIDKAQWAAEELIRKIQQTKPGEPNLPKLTKALEELQQEINKRLKEQKDLEETIRKSREPNQVK